MFRQFFYNIIILLCFILQACSNGTEIKNYESKFKNHTFYPQTQQKRSIKQASDFDDPNQKISRKNINIALMLPLSGQNQKLGQSLFDSAQLALHDSQLNYITILPIDTASTNYSAQRSFNFLIKNNVKLVIGPVFSSKLRPIRKLALKHDINVISFSNDIRNLSDNIYLFGFSPIEQIEHVTDYVAQDKNIKNIYAILPANRYGRLINKSLIRKSKYYEKIYNTKFHIELYGNNAESIELVTKKVLSTMNLNEHNAVLIPENGENLMHIMRHFRSNDSSKISFIGSGQWEDNKTLDIELIEGGIFAGTEPALRQNFEDTFYATFGYEPMRLATIAYDAMSLATTIAKDGHEFNEDILKMEQGFIGIDGTFRFNENQIVQRNLSILEITDESFKIIKRASNHFKNMPNYDIKDKKPEHFFY